MIEDNKLGLKIAENHDEAMWERVRVGLETDIKASESALKVSREFLKVAEKKLAEFPEHKKKEKKKPIGVD